jgi:hypothetical protein
MEQIRMFLSREVPTWYALLAVGVIVLANWTDYLRRRSHSRRKGKRMDLKKGRIRDGYVASLYSLYGEGVLNWTDYVKEMRRLRAMGFDVEYRIALHPEAVKAECRKLKDAILNRRKQTDQTPAPIPDGPTLDLVVDNSSPTAILKRRAKR